MIPASGFEVAVSRFQKHRKVRIEKFWSFPRKASETVLAGLHLFLVIEDIADVGARLTQRGGQAQRDGNPALHVRRAAPSQDVAVDLGRKVACNRNGVQVAGEDDGRAGMWCTLRHDRVPVPKDCEAIEPTKRGLHKIGDRGLTAADRGDVDQRSSDRLDWIGEPHVVTVPSRASAGAGRASACHASRRG